METINEKLDAIFMVWQREKNLEFFVKDGLTFKKEDRNIDVDAEWKKLSRRVLFLLKDQPQNGGNWDDDCREWTKKDNVANLKLTLFRRIANLFYGLSHITANEYNQVWYGELDMEKVKEHFNTVPFGYMECKKEPGGPKVDNKVMRECMQRDHNFIDVEIEIIDPNIIVCCGAPQYEYIINMFGRENLIDTGCYGNKGQTNLQYCPKRNVVILYTEHPSVIEKGKPVKVKDKEHYDVAMDNFRHFLKTAYGKTFLGE